MRPLARPVDFAAAANKTGKSTADLQIDLSVHKSSGGVKRLRPTPARNRQNLAALDRNRFTRLHPDPFSTPEGIATSSQPSNSSTNTPAAVVRIVIGIPKRA